jgi:hypothetical protein
MQDRNRQHPDHRAFRLERPFRMSMFGGMRLRWAYDDDRHTRLDGYIPEPDVELEDAELSDSERDAAIGRERLRREQRNRRRP